MNYLILYQGACGVIDPDDDGDDPDDDGDDPDDDGDDPDDDGDDPDEFNAGVDGVLFGNPQISDSVLLTKLSLGLSDLQNCFTCSGVSPCEF
jgi:hypothetical protein